MLNILFGFTFFNQTHTCDFLIQNFIIQIDEPTPKPTQTQEDQFHENSDKLTAVNLQILHNLWLPDVEILNLKAFETHRVLSKLEGVWIDNDHRLLYALATRITFICPMKFNAFPMDIQRCLLGIIYEISRYLKFGYDHVF